MIFDFDSPWRNAETEAVFNEVVTECDDLDEIVAGWQEVAGPGFVADYADQLEQDMCDMYCGQEDEHSSRLTSDLIKLGLARVDWRQVAQRVALLRPGQPYRRPCQGAPMPKQETVRAILKAHPCPDCGRVEILNWNGKLLAVCRCCPDGSFWDIETIRNQLNARELLKLSQG